MANLYCINCGNEWFEHDDEYEESEPIAYGKCWKCQDKDYESELYEGD